MAAAIAVAPGTPVELACHGNGKLNNWQLLSVSVSRHDQRPFIREDDPRRREPGWRLRRLGVSAGALTAQANNPKLTKELALWPAPEP